MRQPAPDDELADWALVDAFMAAARQGEFDRLLQLLPPHAVVTADDQAVRAGSPRRIDDRDDVAAFFDGSVQAALTVFVDRRAGAAWFHRGQVKVLFEFAVVGGLVHRITFRADPRVRSEVSRRVGEQLQG